MPSVRTLTLPVALALVLASCGKTGVRREAGLNVLLVTIDTLRADAVGAYGNSVVSTPWIDRLAADGVRFASAQAQNVVTLPSHANILSGIYPVRHGVHDNAGFRFPSQIDTIATRLKSRGYRTGAFVSAFPLDVRFGLGRGFDVYDDQYGKAGADHTAFRMPERRGTDTVAAAMKWIAAAPAPWFAWVHLYEPHFPYTPPEPFASRYKSAPYLGEVSAVDAALAPLVQPIVEQAQGGRTLVVLTSDHGESLGEHGEMTHGLFAYQSTLHVPLIMFQPRLLTPRVVSEPVRHVDIVPTVLDALGERVPGDLDGRSLLPLIAGLDKTPAASYFESLSASLNRAWAPIYGVSNSSLKYIDLPIPELYDLAADPGETHNLFADRRAEVPTLQNLLNMFRAAGAPSTPARESAETRERLRTLGYATATPAAKTRFTEEDDPKRLVAIDHDIDNVVSRYQAGDLSGAIALAEEVVRKRPDMPLSLTHLAFLQNEAGNHRAAVDAIRRALALNPAAQDVAALAGAYLTEAGLPREAVERLAPYARDPHPDVDVLIAYGVALASAGRARDALAEFARARAADPANAMPLVDAGTVYLMEGNRDQASAAFKQALQVDPTVARAYNALGVIAAQQGHYDEAVAHWKRAIALDPRDHQTLYNLGDLLIRLGQTSEARPYWERYIREAPPALEARDIARVRQWLGQSHDRDR